MLADRSVARWLDSFAMAPVFESISPELRPLVANQITWCLARSSNGAAKHRTNLDRRGFLSEQGIPHDPAGEMIFGKGDPETSKYSAEPQVSTSSELTKVRRTSISAD